MFLGEQMDHMLFVHKREYCIPLKMNELDLHTLVRLISETQIFFWIFFGNPKFFWKFQKTQIFFLEKSKLQENTYCDNIDMHLKIGKRLYSLIIRKTYRVPARCQTLFWALGMQKWKERKHLGLSPRVYMVGRHHAHMCIAKEEKCAS